MRTQNLSSISATVTYPDALAYAFNAMPVVVNISPSSTVNKFAVKITSPELGDEFYYMERTANDGKVTFDVSELVRIQYEELLRRDTTGSSLLAQSTKQSMTITNYNKVGGGYANTSELFELSRFVRQFTLTLHKDDIAGTVLLTANISVIYGRGGYVNELAPDITKIWCGASECMQFIIGKNTRVTIPGRNDYLKTVISPNVLNDQYIGIVLKGNISWGNGSYAPMPEYIEVTNAPYFAADGKLNEKPTQRIEFTSQYVNDGDYKPYITYLSPSGDVVTLPVKRLSKIATSEVVNTSISGDVIAEPDFAKPILTSRKANTYAMNYKCKYSTILLPQSEAVRVRNVIGATYAELRDNDITNVIIRVFPVPASAEIGNKTLASFAFEVELPQLNNVGR